jgi:cytidine deaminase
MGAPTEGAAMSVGTCLQKELASFPPSGQKALASIILDPSFRGVITTPELDGLASQIGETVDDLLLLLVPFAQCYAIPPVSDYPVGVVAQGQSGAAYFGANMEYKGTALSFTVHGEQSATTNAWLNGEQGLTSIAISAAPCGYCRQFLYETTTADTLLVLLTGQSPQLLTALIPQAFGPNDLGVTAALMSPANNGLSLSPPPTDPVVKAALAAANASYAPYSKGYAGVAIATASGAIYTGRYAENAAFNPSMSPLESALTMWSFGGNPNDAIKAAVLVELPSLADQAAVTMEVLSTIAPTVTVQVYKAIQ